MVIESLMSVITEIITHLKLFVRYFFAETHKESSSDKKKFKYFEKLHPKHTLVARSSVNQPCRFVGLFICIWSASSGAVRLFRMLPPLVYFYLFKYYSFSFHICEWDKTLQHTMCIPHWNDVEKFVYTSFQRVIHVVCLEGSCQTLKMFCRSGFNGSSQRHTSRFKSYCGFSFSTAAFYYKQGHYYKYGTTFRRKV